MIKSTMAMFPRTLLWLICFALFCCLPGCGGSGGGGADEEVTYTFTVTTTPAVDTFKAGEIVTITVTVTGSDGLPASGQAVTFTIFRNNSGGTLTIDGTGTTDGDGKALATYTLGTNNSTESVTDTIEISIPDYSETLTINREGETFTVDVEADSTTLAAGGVATITATVNDSSGQPAAGQAVSFTISTNESGGTITISGTGTTDENGVVEAYYTAGANSPTEQVQDQIDITIPTDTASVTITRSVADQVASLDLAADPTSILTDGTTTSTITVNALNTGNAILTGVTVTLSTDTGVLSAPSVTTPGTVRLSCGNNKVNRTATVTATTTAAGGNITSQIPIQIEGSTVTVTSDATSLSTGAAANLTITTKDAGGNLVSGAEVTLTQSSTNGGRVTLGATTGTTDASGKFTTTATGNTDGTITITADALGATGTSDITVSSPIDTFYISNLILDGSEITNTSTTALKINASGTPFTPNSLRIIVHAPADVNNVTFATTIGVWDSGVSKSIAKAVFNDATYGRIAEATLTTTTIGVANVQVYDTADDGTNDTLTVAMSSGATPAKISLQVTPSVVPISVGTTTGSSTLTATVTDVSNNPLGGQPVLFSIVNGTSTSGGETIVPVVVMTASVSSGDLTVGQARTTFTAGSMPSAATGVQIRATVVGTTVETEPIGVNITDSGNDQKIVIGGVAGSIAFGQATAIGVDETNSNYTWKMSVLVSDANGNAVEGAVVSLGVWPIAWSTGFSCGVDADTPNSGTFWNEDRNENLILDTTPAPSEDGWRCYYADPTKSDCVAGGGTPNTEMTPTNSRGGSLPASVTTDENGVAGFTLTYPKQSALWTIDRIRATTSVQGSETRAEIIFTLPALDSDITPCRLGDSPYIF